MQTALTGLVSYFEGYLWDHSGGLSLAIDVSQTNLRASAWHGWSVPPLLASPNDP